MRNQSLPMRSSRIDHLDGIRGIAILGVVAFHFMGGVLPLLRAGWIGVDVFLVLSGFLITSILIRSSSTSDLLRYRAFVWARIRRLYPALCGLVLASIVVTNLATGPRVAQYRPTAGSVALTLGQLAWIPPLANWDTHSRLFIHCWTLSIEWTFYLVWPWLVWLAVRRLGRQAWLVVASCAFGWWIVCASVLPWQWLYLSPVARPAQITIGCALALFMHNRDWSPAREGRRRAAAGLFVGSLTFIAAWAVVSPVHDVYRWGGFVLIPVATVGLIVSGYLSPFAARVLSFGPLRGLGAVSYSLYLWHFPCQRLTHPDVLGMSKPASAALLLIATALTTGLSYWYLERPYFKGRPPGSAAIAPTDAFGRVSEPPDLSPQ